MTSLALKIFALISMLSDHTAVYMAWGKMISDDSFLYGLMRSFGRLAFPIFCFLIVEGVKHTRNKKKYFLRLFIGVIVSEIFWDWFVRFKWIDIKSQSVMVTLLFGACIVSMYQWVKTLSKEKKIWGIAAILGVLAVMYVLEWGFHSDYGMNGIWMISVMGLSVFEIPKAEKLFQNQRFYQAACAAAGILILCILKKDIFELYAFFSLIPILLYNGQSGKRNKWIQYSFYVIYPLQFLILYMIFLFPKFGFVIQ